MSPEIHREKKDNVYDAIIAAFEDSGFSYTVAHHEPIYTMEDTRGVVGEDLKGDVKTLLVKLKGANRLADMCLVAVSGDSRIDFKAIAAATHAKRASLADPEAVKALLGIDIGAVSPFGYSTPLPLVWDPRLDTESSLHINPGVHDATLTTSASDLRRLCENWSPHFIQLDAVSGQE